MNEKTLATFKIEVRQWELFKTKVSNSGSNATQTILDLISAYLDDRVSIAPNIEEGTVALIDEKLDAAISPLKSDLESLKAEIEVLKASNANQPKIPLQNDLQQTINHAPIHLYVPQKCPDLPLIASVVKPLYSKASVCLYCGSSEIVSKGASESKPKNGLVGRRIRCKVCKKYSTLWLPVE